MRGALSAYSALEPFSDVSALAEAIRGGGISATVVIVDAATFETAEAALRRIHASFAAHPLVAYYDPRGLTPRHLLALAQSGVADLVQLDVDDSRHVFGRIIESATRVSHAKTLTELLIADIPHPLRSVFTFALEHAGRRMDVPELAAALGISKRTLAYRLERYGLPTPRVFLTWCQLLVAALLLDERGRTLDSVAGQLNFSGGHALGGVFFRYLGCGVMTLREHGVLDEVVAGFRMALTTPGASLPLTLRQG